MHFKILFVAIVFGLTLSCNQQNKNQLPTKKISVKSKVKNETKTEIKTKPDTIIPKVIAQNNLINIQTLDPSILVDVKYASTDNFMQQRLYFNINEIYLQKDVAERLVLAQKLLKNINPNLTLLIYDGVRPLSIQKKMWEALDSIPVQDRVKFVSNPKNGSIHNYGAAVDLTLADAKSKTPLDMGAGYDDIREIAYPRLENHFLQLGELTQEQIDNRKLLRKVMASQNFQNIATEWWHFNACSRESAKKRYKITY